MHYKKLNVGLKLLYILVQRGVGGGRLGKVWEEDGEAGAGRRKIGHRETLTDQFLHTTYAASVVLSFFL